MTAIRSTLPRRRADEKSMHAETEGSISDLQDFLAKSHRTPAMRLLRACYAPALRAQPTHSVVT